MTIKYFRAQKDTRRFRKNQKVWVVIDHANHAQIRFKWRGKGRYVNGVIAKFSLIKGEWTLNRTIGEDGFKEIEVDDLSAERLVGLDSQYFWDHAE